MKAQSKEAIDPLSVSAKTACLLIGVGLTRLYQLMGAGEIKSYRDGKSRKVEVASLKAYVQRQLDAEAAKAPSRWTERATSARVARKASQ